ncbi:MAG: AbrB/MazE/SpoVT family DNA-binding domain-containing protein [Microgenomates group bacterium]
MSYLVSITSQGQISIPAEIRRELGLLEKRKALVKREGKRVIIEPAEDIFSLAGAFKHKAIKGKTIQEIIKIEEQAWEKEAAKRYLKTLRR